MKSIQRSIVWLTLAVVLGLLVVLGTVSLASVISKADADASVAMNLTCANEASAINELLEGIEDAVDIEAAYMQARAGEVPDVAEWLGEGEELFSTIANMTPGAVAYYFHSGELGADLNGFFYIRDGEGGSFRLIDSAVPGGALPGASGQVTGYDLGLDKDALRAGNALWMEPFEAAGSGMRIIIYTEPLFVDGEYRGTVGMGVDFQLIVDRVEAISSYKEGYGFLTDANGNVMYHPTIPYGTNLSEDDEEVPAVDAAIAAGTTTDDVVVYQYHGTDKRMAFHLLQNDMRLVLSVDAKEIYADRDRLVGALLLSTVFSAVVVTIIATVASRRMLRPLRLLTEAAEQVAAGDLSVELPKADVREVSSLVSAYDKTVDELRAQMATIDEMAHRDALTGLLNKASFKEASAEVDERIAAGEDFEFTLAMLDVNGLKQMNDTFGHEAGDDLLRNAAGAIVATFERAGASFYRVGGDEFAVLVMGQAKDMDTVGTVERDDVSIACGVAHYRPSEDANTAAVLARADARMYQNKRSAR